MKVDPGVKTPGLYLENGLFFKARNGFGNCTGKICAVHSRNFLEIPTDSSAKGLILCFSFPQAGFADPGLEEMETLGHRASGVVLGNIAATEAGEELKKFYKDQGIALLEGVDTRALALHLSLNPLSGELFSGQSAESPRALPLKRRIPNRGLIYQVIGEVPFSLMRDLVDIGCELVEYADSPFSVSLKADGIFAFAKLKGDEIEQLTQINLPVILVGLAAQCFAAHFGCKLQNKGMFNSKLPVEDLFDSPHKIVLPQMRVEKTLAAVPGEVLFLDHYSKRPVGFRAGNVIGTEFLPNRYLLERFIERGCYRC